MLAIGSSSTVGVGASSPSATYVAKLETTLEGTFKGMDFDVIGRGLSGEVAQGAADRMKQEVEQTKPDLVVWQVGTNDAHPPRQHRQVQGLPQDDAGLARGATRSTWC